MTKSYIIRLLLPIGIIFISFTDHLAQNNPVRPIARTYCNKTFALDSDCKVELHYSEIDQGSYDEGGERLQYLLHVEGQMGESVIIDCPNIGLRQINLEVVNESGLRDTSQTLVEIQVGNCPDDFCEIGPPMPLTLIDGIFMTSKGIPINGVELFVDGQSMGKFNQQYCIALVDSQMQESIEASKKDDIRNGLTTLDLILIRREVLQLGDLSTDYARVAGDVNDDQKLSALDLIQIRQVILRQIDEFSSVPIWKFIPANYEFGKTTWENPIPFYWEINTALDEFESDFIGIKMGDVDFSADVTRRSREHSLVEVEDVLLESGISYKVAFNLEKETRSLRGYQLELDLNTEAITLNDIHGLRRDVEYNLVDDNSKLMISTIEENNQSGELFVLELKAKKKGYLSEFLSLSNDYLLSEAYTKEALDIHDMRIEWKHSDGKNCKSSSNPNPFIFESQLEYYVKEEGEVRIYVYNAQGQKVYSKSLYASQGCHSHVVAFDLSATKGVYFYKILTPEAEMKGKMIKV